MKCPKCGYEMGPFDAECERCKRASGQPSSGAPRCGHCGAELAGSQVQFCGACGKPTGPASRRKPVGAWGYVALGTVAVGAVILTYFGFMGTSEAGRQAVQQFEDAQRFEQAAVQRSQPAGVTLAQFEAITAGMSLQQVQSILGPGQLMSQTSIPGIGTSEMYQWSGRGDLGANMNIMLQDGQVVSKAQFGLR